jgi:hypothetical protein
MKFVCPHCGANAFPLLSGADGKPCGGMLELRKSVDVSSIDAAGSAIGRSNTDVPGCEEITV